MASKGQLKSGGTAVYPTISLDNVVKSISDSSYVSIPVLDSGKIPVSYFPDDIGSGGEQEAELDITSLGSADGVVVEPASAYFWDVVSSNTLGASGSSGNIGKESFIRTRMLGGTVTGTSDVVINGALASGQVNDCRVEFRENQAVVTPIWSGYEYIVTQTAYGTTESGYLFYGIAQDYRCIQVASGAKPSTGATASNTYYTSNMMYPVWIRVDSGATLTLNGASPEKFNVLASGGMVYASNGATRSAEGGGNGSPYSGLTAEAVGGIFVLSGSAVDNTISSGGLLYVRALGYISKSTVSSLGKAYVSSAGSANDTTISSGGTMVVYANGITSRCIIKSGGTLIVSSTGSATGIEYYQGAVVISRAGAVIFGKRANGIYSGTISGTTGYTASNTTSVISNKTINTCMKVYSNGSASAIVGSGEFYVNDGGVVDTITLNVKATLQVSSGGSALNIKENGGGAFVYEGATATFIPNSVATVNLATKAATLHSGTSIDTITNQGISVYVYNGGLAGTINNTKGGKVFVYSGGVANTISGVARIYVSGGFVSNVILTHNRAYDTFLMVSSGGVVDHLTVNARTTGATYYNAFVFNGGILNNITLNANTYVAVWSGGVVNYANLGASEGILSISSGGVGNYITVGSIGYLRVSSGGTVNSVTVNSGGVFWCYGVANSATINYFGGIRVSSGASAINTICSSGARAIVHMASTTYFQGEADGGEFEIKDGFVSNYTVGENCVLQVSSGCTALDVKEDGGYVGILDGAYVTFVPNVFSNKICYSNCTLHSGTTGVSTTVSATVATISVNVYDGGVASNFTIKGSGNDTVGWCIARMYIFSGGVAASTTLTTAELHVSSGGTAEVVNATNVSAFAYISGGGVASKVTVTNGYVVVSRGAIVNSATIRTGALFTVLARGIASNVTVNASASARISSGGTAINVTENGGYVFADTGANVTFVSKTLSKLVINASTTIHSGTTANSTTVAGGGYFYVYSGGTANIIAVNKGGRLFVYSGGKALNVTSNSGSVISVYTGGSITYA